MSFLLLSLEWYMLELSTFCCLLSQEPMSVATWVDPSLESEPEVLGTGRASYKMESCCGRCSNKSIGSFVSIGY